ncbi:stress response protein nst1 [Trichonephila inaurata madagascariensis]|uniref:Stress response protein nst1 n=1 Tax=Trichonephila inaurata madagascariensis TaxID=2747483 RepID=A0A8X6Y7G7_9ARAC|nr:stress response protein nst1 [Trichonephila inaurata madagascariensis]
MVIEEREKAEMEREKARAEFDLEKLRLQNFKIKTESNHINGDVWDMHKEKWVSSLLGLLPYEITKLIAREPEEKAKDYNHVKRLLLKGFKLSPESFGQKFFNHYLSSENTWKDFVYELRLCFEEWLRGIGENDFEKLKDLFITKQLKKGISTTTQEHFIDDWSNLINPEELADKLHVYENGRKERNKNAIITCKRWNDPKK